jgi:hypothetical protein
VYIFFPVKIAKTEQQLAAACSKQHAAAASSKQQAACSSSSSKQHAAAAAASSSSKQQQQQATSKQAAAASSSSSSKQQATSKQAAAAAAEQQQQQQSSSSRTCYGDPQMPVVESMTESTPQLQLHRSGSITTENWFQFQLLLFSIVAGVRPKTSSHQPLSVCIQKDLNKFEIFILSTGRLESW